MPEYLSPGVYVEEIPGGARPISAVGTSTAAFFGRAPKSDAAPRTPTLVTGWSEFGRLFIPELERHERPSPFATAVAGFFLNGGRKAYVVDIGEAETLTGDDLALIEAIEGISLVAAPGFTDIESHEALLADCERRKDRFAVLDTDESIEPLTDLTRSRQDGGARPRTSDRGIAALYTPWITVVDALTGERVDVPPSGHVCGLYATTDGTRGVHKAPANAPLRGALGVARRISAREQELLNPAGVNCIRVFESGIRVWGARTLADASSDFRYVPVRRLVTMISQSIERGTRWVVFEPNDLTLWKSIRRDVGNFLNGLWRDGALAGAAPEQAYFVKCDAETTTQTDIDEGRVVALIGIAPVKPAEFVIIRIGQSVGQSAVEVA